MSPMIPATIHGMPAMVCISAMQKFIRRGMEREAMEMACEVMHTSKPFHSMVCNRLLVICHEDLDMVEAPEVYPFVFASLERSRELYKKNPQQPGEARLFVGNCIRLMCRTPKSREGCHFGAAIGLRSLYEHFAPEIPDFAYDQHTSQGKKMKRGIEHFRAEGAKLAEFDDPGEDVYIEEAYRLWKLKEQTGAPPDPRSKRQGNLFDKDGES